MLDHTTSFLYPIIFYCLAGFSVLTSICIVFFRNPIYSTLSLIANLVAVSVIYVLLNAQLLALINVIVYAGAIMVLFIFVVMLINEKNNTQPPVLKKSKFKTLLVFVSVIGIALSFVGFALRHLDTHQNGLIEAQSSVGLVESLGFSLFTNYVLPFELTGILFLVALIGAVILAKK